MLEFDNLPDAKLYQALDNEGLVPHVPEDMYDLEETVLGTRLLVETKMDRVEMFKKLLDVYPGPFFLTVVVQEPYGAFKTAGRYHSEYDKTRIQVDYFLDYFHDFICYSGFIHVWVTCQTTKGIVVYDQHDYYFVYEKALEAAEIVKGLGFVEGSINPDFAHAHSSRPDIHPGPEELLNYGNWRLESLQIQDVARPEEKTIRNMYLRFRNWVNTRRIKRRGR